MCAIMGYTAKDIPVSQLQQGFAATKSRGPDDSRVLETKSGTLLFHRLAIMGPEPAGMQPFSTGDGSAVVCNGELYGWRKQRQELEARGYVFRSGSDCELLLPLVMAEIVDTAIPAGDTRYIFRLGAAMLVLSAVSMACGVGACLSCVVDTVGGKRRACVDGPVFPAEEVVW